MSIESVAWPNSEEKYEINTVIGIGSTSVVFGAFCKLRNEKCAIKQINLEKWTTSIDEMWKEIQAMSNCNHENVVAFYTSFVVRDELWLVLPLLEAGSLLDVIKHKIKVTKCKQGVFNEETIATVLKEVLRGLEYFHNNGQIHRDIKAGNILLGQDGTVQIADFGVSAWLANGRDLSRQKVRHTFAGTPCWIAPEVMDQDKGYDFKADIWSFGITAIEMATGTAPYHKFPPMKVLMLTLQNEPPTLETGGDGKEQYKAYGKCFRKMLADCLQKDPSKRPNATELLKHPFIKKAKDRKYLAQTLVAMGPTLESREHKENMVKRESRESPESTGESFKESDEIINIMLRIRNDENNLKDINFEFLTGKDTAESITLELVGTGLISPCDSVPISTNLCRLLETQSDATNQTKTIIFSLNSTGPNQKLDENTLVGFAQISISDSH